MTDDLLNRLRADRHFPDGSEAAAEIERLRAERDAALEKVRLAAFWTVEPGTTIAEIKAVLAPPLSPPEEG